MSTFDAEDELVFAQNHYADNGEMIQEKIKSVAVLVTQASENVLVNPDA